MAKNSIRDYSATSSLNTDVQSVDISEGCAASGINNAIREVMADLKDVSSGTIALETPSADQLNVDNIRIDGNTISSTDTNGDITLDPDGTGDVIVASGNVGIGTTSPGYPMELASSSGAGTQFGITYVPNSVTLLLRAGGGDVNVGSVGSHPLLLKTGNAEKARIDTSGRFLVYKNTSGLASPGLEANFTADNGFLGVTSTAAVAYFNREDSDGTIIVFRHDNATEGSISVSGTTVSYNGGHLARWSQLADNTKDTSLVKGTVMTNLDQMAEWTKDGVTEDNEQLNCMAVSSVEGDANVAGVFVNWDDDDEDYTADMNVAMTGDMVIRIASGTTVARGDLLMSAGDGTAKPQGDDIVRSKTIAKVTSTTVSHTYDDGSYLVPCVLMAC